MGLIPGLARSPEEENNNPFHYACLGYSMDKEAWWGIVHGAAKSQTRVSDQTATKSGLAGQNG